MKVVHRLPDEPDLIVVTTFPDGANVAPDLAGPVGVGNPFLAFDSLPPAVEGSPAADFAGAPLVSEDDEENRAAIAAMLAAPPLSKVRPA
jgi:hypothetical protein